jgi:hypothetical protein
LGFLALCRVLRLASGEEVRTMAQRHRDKSLLLVRDLVTRLVASGALESGPGKKAVEAIARLEHGFRTDDLKKAHRAIGSLCRLILEEGSRTKEDRIEK